MTINEILEYVMHTPGNTNPAVLKDQLKQLVAGGGGNPNMVYTVQGTLDNPWGEFTYRDLVELVKVGWANIIITLDATAIGFYTVIMPVAVDYIMPNPTGLVAVGVTASQGAGIIMSVFIRWQDYVDDASGNINLALIKTGDSNTDLTAYASMVPTELTIIWHPLPES